jgi:hypothetical protein
MKNQMVRPLLENDAYRHLMAECRPTAYMLAMLQNNFFHKKVDVKITLTDLTKLVIREARKGIY